MKDFNEFVNLVIEEDSKKSVNQIASNNEPCLPSNQTSALELSTISLKVLRMYHEWIQKP